MKKSNIKRILSGVFAMLMVCCIAFTTQGLTVNAAIVSGGKKNYSYKELKTDLKQLQKKYRDHCQVNVIGKTADKRNLYEVVIGNPNAKKHLLVIGNLHAREHMTVQLCMKQIEYYLNNYNKKINGKKVSATLNKVAIHYVPSCNPDGTAISQKGFNAIRNKSLRNGLRRMGGSSSKWKANARGVDLNRNWNVAFKKAGKKVRNITTRMYKLAKSLTRYHLMPTESISVARGCSREYFLYKRNIPCITIEVGVGAAPLSGREFNSIWNKNKNVVIREAQLFD